MCTIKPSPRTLKFSVDNSNTTVDSGWTGRASLGPGCHDDRETSLLLPGDMAHRGHSPCRVRG
jgi:hypothetical protein